MPFCPECGTMRPPAVDQRCVKCGTPEPPKEATLEELHIRPDLSEEERKWIDHRLRQMEKQKIWEVPGRRGKKKRGRGRR